MKFTTWLMSAGSINKNLDGIIKQVVSRALYFFFFPEHFKKKVFGRN